MATTVLARDYVIAAIARGDMPHTILDSEPDMYDINVIGAKVVARLMGGEPFADSGALIAAANHPDNALLQLAAMSVEAGFTSSLYVILGSDTVKRDIEAKRQAAVPAAA